MKISLTSEEAIRLAGCLTTIERYLDYTATQLEEKIKLSYKNVREKAGADCLIVDLVGDGGAREVLVDMRAVHPTVKRFFTVVREAQELSIHPVIELDGVFFNSLLELNKNQADFHIICHRFLENESD